MKTKFCVVFLLKGVWFWWQGNHSTKKKMTKITFKISVKKCHPSTFLNKRVENLKRFREMHWRYFLGIDMVNQYPGLPEQRKHKLDKNTRVATPVPRMPTWHCWWAVAWNVWALFNLIPVCHLNGALERKGSGFSSMRKSTFALDDTSQRI